MLRLTFTINGQFFQFALPPGIEFYGDDFDFLFGLDCRGGFGLSLDIRSPFNLYFWLHCVADYPLSIFLNGSEVRLHSPKDWIALARLILRL